ncbi:hypothetical protein RRG08_043195 [Elysia crispata]|uniref:Uncharacterized protein n=1 Tax=Elysia crispata TaxID=231223 RepID=A0AAE0ZIF5_9GAST|nr:hypothetical protein RRG08_043195 [Elysia crispata]
MTECAPVKQPETLVGFPLFGKSSNQPVFVSGFSNSTLDNKTICDWTSTLVRHPPRETFRQTPSKLFLAKLNNLARSCPNYATNQGARGNTTAVRPPDVW